MLGPGYWATISCLACLVDYAISWPRPYILLSTLTTLANPHRQSKSVTRSYFRGASGALLVFDITRRATFVHATDWLNDLRAIAEPDIVVILVGNKLDCVQSEAAPASNNSDKREVTFAEAQEWAQKNGVLQYVETSAKSGENVEAAFMRVAERIFENINAGKYDLNDRRSGVKGPGPGTAAARGVNLSTNEKKGSSIGGCC